MIRYITLRLLSLVLVVFGVTLVVFVLTSALPGDPATALLGPYATPERVVDLRRSLALDGSLPERYFAWLGHALSGDLGHSYSLGRPVLAVVLERLRPTALLAASALGLGTALGLTLGSLAAVRPGTLCDRALTLISLVGVSTPAFWIAMVLMLVFGIELGLFPVSGMRRADVLDSSSLVTVVDIAHHLVLPATALGMVAAGVIARMTRAALVEVLSTDYVRLARASGAGESNVRYVYAFRAALSRVVPVIGLQAGFALGGAAYVETVFQWPGLGKLLVDAIAERDLLLVQGGVMLVAVLYVLVTFATDLVQRSIDPRVDA